MGMCLAQHVAIAIALVLTASTADARPRWDVRPDDSLVGTATHDLAASHDDDVEAPAKRRLKRVVRDEVDDADEDDNDEDDDDTDVALVGASADEVDAVVRDVQKRMARKNDWTVAVGPYFWLSSVDAKVSFGDASVSTGVDFFQITRHTKYGGELQGEVRYGRWSLATDAMYGVIGLAANKEVGPFMVALDGTASSLLVDGHVGFRLAGGDHTWFSVDARAGARYQRTSIAGKVNVAGAEVVDTSQSDYGADAVAGARASLQPCRRFSVSAAFDKSVAGMSNTTYSASADANVRISSHVLLSAGYRTLTIDRAHVAITMHGPRFALQFLF